MDGKLFLRKVTENDMLMLFKWANDPDVRKNAFHSETITLEEHTNWFNKLIMDDSQYQYILMCDDIAVGQIRLSVENNNSAEIDYSIASEYRGRGLGKKILELLRLQVKKDMPHINKLIGRVKSGNIASESCFQSSGYENSFIQYELNLMEK